MKSAILIRNSFAIKNNNKNDSYNCSHKSHNHDGDYSIANDGGYDEKCSYYKRDQKDNNDQSNFSHKDYNKNDADNHFHNSHHNDMDCINEDYKKHSH